MTDRLDAPTVDHEPNDPLDDPRTIRAVQEYLATLEAGERPDRKSFLNRYPEIAGPLAECLDALEFVHAAAPRCDHPSGKTEATKARVEPSLDTAIPLGDFRLLREIGRGGMGVVYEAEQLSLGRRIALKVLPFAMTLDSRQIQRFKNEARAAAQLHHSHIVPIYSVGCERGVHFYAMQYIEGQTLAAIIDGLREMAPNRRGLRVEMGEADISIDVSSSAGRDSVPLAEPVPDYLTTMLQRLGSTQRSISTPVFIQTVTRLGMQAAEALEHAHQFAVIHRDIKPGNLLLDVQGHLWVTDFGLAQLQNDVALTRTGDVVGTLRYMSPEQALARRGIVDHRTDIYALGATLYELLTLHPVFSGRDRHELMRQISFDEPKPLRKFNPAIPIDLETIILKALGKRLEDRYSTAQELAEDLRRFLEHRPIQARSPAPWERAARWARRHTPLVYSAVALLVLASIGLGVTTVLIAREQAKTRKAYEELAAEQQRTQAAFEAETRQRELADKRFKQARQMLDEFTQISEVDLADKPQAREVRRKLLEAALEYYQQYIEQHADNPVIREELVATNLRVANILQEIGSPDDALAALEKARQGQEKLAREHPTIPEYGQRLGDINSNLNWMRDGARLFLLSEASVQKELKLPKELAKQFTELSEQRRTTFRGRSNFTPEAWRAKLDDLALQEKNLLRNLEAEQVLRLDQITWQHLGSGAFADPQIEKALSLTPPQSEKIRSILVQAWQARGNNHRSPGGPPPHKSRDPNKTMQQVLNVLTAEQAGKWKQMIGTPFKTEHRPGHGWHVRRGDRPMPGSGPGPKGPPGPP